MDGKTALVTGAVGEMGHLLVPALKAKGYDVVALDLAPVPLSMAASCVETAQASVLDAETLSRLFARHRFGLVLHLAALLSTKAEADPDLAHAVNVGGTVGILGLCRAEAQRSRRSVRVLFPSSIAVYGLPDAPTKERAGAVSESEWNRPAGMYGCNKLYCEMLGSYFTARALARREPGVDFRAIRFPGLISAETLPTGGTSDYAPEMIHAAAQGRPYACFVRADTRMPFMTMPDAIDALMRLVEADPRSLTTRVYNIGAFSPSAAEIRDVVLAHFPDACITFEPVPARQAIVDTWPADVDDHRAREDWGHSPRHGLLEAVRDYLVPALMVRYPVRATR